ncbi:hypothetical protein L210DRAFT_623382 [Boletus edulis BED1]|uniref:Uncharacterized protein n=1 Tax=Boletus edulis BED1 TaxID=1328754 RepID=A0AAD4C4J1_BOLED|nr:hypothetical protein L210DRAFT_623382 [Boletus edulis BED1]
MFVSKLPDVRRPRALIEIQDSTSLHVCHWTASKLKGSSHPMSLGRRSNSKHNMPMPMSLSPRT